MSSCFCSAASISQHLTAVSADPKLRCKLFNDADGVSNTASIATIISSICLINSFSRCIVSAYLVVMFIGKPIIRPPAGPGGIPIPCGIGKVSIIFKAAFSPPNGGFNLPGIALNFDIRLCTCWRDF